MKSTFRSLSVLKAVLPAAVLALAGIISHAQTAPQITRPVSDSELSTLKGNVHPLAKAAFDKGVIPASTPTGSLLLTLKRSATQETALQKFLADVQVKGSPAYHHWLTPEQFGNQYGIADSDLMQVETWLRAQGFTVEKVAAGRTAVQFSGTAGQVSNAFHTTLHSYQINAEIHHSNATDPQIPAALAPVIAGVSRLNDFHPVSQAKLLGRAKYDSVARHVTPEWTTPTDSGTTAYAVGPADFATQYNVGPVYKAGINGTGQTIGVINDSNIDLGVVQSYRKLFNLDPDPTKPNLPHVIIDGNDPGVNGDSTEAYLDVEMAGAIAPQATINFYIAANTDFNDGLDLAIMRAVEDDKATVLSLSFGNCEASAGASYLAYINSVWEQAAAQGQTVMVSSGDNSSAGCDDQNNPFFASDGLQVNGLSSTPWNIAVGGTDFYYSDYATGGASITQDWSATSDASLGSLLHPLPEQPWNNSIYGLNIVPTTSVSVVGGSGGQSSCAVVDGPMSGKNPLTTQGYCLGLGGYPKPQWQAGPGVPADGVRDLPDVSLFAAFGGNNSFYAICAAAGDCVTTDPIANVLYYTGVGGTSASAPAFAGIMSLINQKYGPQGQADAVLYPLAAQMPSVFHDVTVGSNNVPCTQNSPNCEKDAVGTGFSLQNWQATPGYDLASGLGSVDVNALLANWNSVKFTSTTVAFSVSPTTITHGATVTFSTTVAASSGSSIPTGAVAVIADTTLPANKGQLGITLDATGSGAATANFLPGGTYTLKGNYSGDAIFSANESAPITVTVNPESSLLLTNAFEYQTTPYGMQYPLTSPIPYGTIAGIDVQVADVSGNVSGIATGTVIVQDNGTAIATLPLNANGATVYSTGTWLVGNHSITFSYSGDPSYSATTNTNPKAPITFTVGQGTTSISLVGNTSSLPIGGTFVLQIIVSGTSTGFSPTGNVAVTFGSTTQNVALSPTYMGQSTATVTFPNLPAGSYTPTVTYAGDTNWSGLSVTGTTLKVAASTLLPSTATLVSNPATLTSLTPGTLVTLTATIQGSGASPTGGVYFVVDGQEFSSNNSILIPLVPGTNGTSTASVSFVAGNAYGGTNQVYVLYLGDNTYTTSSSPILMFNNDQGDFSILNNNPTVTIASGSSGIANLALTASNQFSGKVNLVCTVTGGGTMLPLCTVPSSVTLASTGQVAASVQLTTKLSTSAALKPANQKWLFGGEGVSVLACVFFFAMPSRRRRTQALLSVSISMIILTSLIGCSNNSPAPIPPPVVPATVPAGTYQAIISATNGVITHNVEVSIVVTPGSGN